MKRSMLARQSSKPEPHDEVVDHVLRSELRRLLDVKAPVVSLQPVRQHKRAAPWRWWKSRSEPVLYRSFHPNTPVCSGFYLMCILRSMHTIQATHVQG